MTATVTVALLSGRSAVLQVDLELLGHHLTVSRSFWDKGLPECQQQTGGGDSESWGCSQGCFSRWPVSGSVALSQLFGKYLETSRSRADIRKAIFLL